jgi:hypothetical protein
MIQPALVLVVLLFGTLSQVPTAAHDVYRIIGTITRWEPPRLDVRDRDGKVLTVEVDSGTRIQRDKKTVSPSALEVGQTVVVDALGDSESELVARDIAIVPPIGRADRLQRSGICCAYSGAHDENVSSERRCVDPVVRDVNHRHRERLRYRRQFVPHARPQVRVQAGQRLVQDQEAGIANQGAREGHTLLFSAGQIAGIFTPSIVQADYCEHLLNS